MRPAGRLLALSGGGYEPCTAPPRAWAALAARMAGVEVTDPVPETWRAIALAAGGPAPARGWFEDAGPAPDAERDRRAAAESDAAIALTRAVLALPSGARRRLTVALGVREGHRPRISSSRSRC
ncbi:MAG: hypothetical protein ACLGG9_09925 [Thermoleophilia bacterium]